MIYVIGIGPGDPSYGLLGQEAYFEKADRILGSERHLEILPPAYRDKGLVPPKNCWQALVRTKRFYIWPQATR